MTENQQKSTSARAIPCYSMLYHSRRSLPWTRCFAHSNNGGRPLHMAYANIVPHPKAVPKATVPHKQGWRSERHKVRRPPLSPSLNPTTNPLTAAALIYALGAGITAGAGTRLVLQLLLSSIFNYYSFRPRRSELRLDSIPLRCLPKVLGVGNFRACCPP